jgi:hypothetical protein
VNVIILIFVDQRDRSQFLSNTALLCSWKWRGWCCCCKRAVGETSLMNVYVTEQSAEQCKYSECAAGHEYDRVWRAASFALNFRLGRTGHLFPCVWFVPSSRNAVENILRSILQNMLHTVLQNVLHSILQDMLHTVLQNVLRSILQGMLNTVLQNVLRSILQNMLHTILQNMLHNTLQNMLHFVLRNRRHTAEHAAYSTAEYAA